MVILTRVAVAQADGNAETCIRASEEALAQRRAGKLLGARTSLAACAAPECPGVVRASCAERLAEVNQSIPSIAFLTKDGEGHDLARVKVTVDDGAYAGYPSGAALSLDPGAHAFRFEAPGRPPVVAHFVLVERDQGRHETVVLPNAADGSERRVIVFALGAAGLAGLVAGGVLGGLAIEAHDAYERQCGRAIGAPPGECTSAGVAGEHDAATKGTLSTVAFFAGGGAIAAGALLFLLAPRGSSGAQIGIAPGGVALTGKF